MREVLVAIYSLLLFIAYQLVAANDRNREFLANHKTILDELVSELKGGAE